MAEDLGQIDIRLTADERQVERAHRKGGEAAGDQMVDQLSSGMTGILSAFAARVGGPQAGALVAGVTPTVAGAAAARNAVGGGVAGAASRVVTGVGTAGIVGGAVALGVAAFASNIKRATDMLKRWSDTLSAETARLATMSPQLARASAESFINQFRIDMERAQTIGPSLAGLERLRNLRMREFAPARNLGAIMRTGAAATLELALIGLGRVVSTVSQVFVRMTGVVTGVVSDIVAAIAGLFDSLGMGGVGNSLRSLVGRLDEIQKQLKKLEEQMKGLNDQQRIDAMNSILLKDLEILTDGKFKAPTPPQNTPQPRPSMPSSLPSSSPSGFPI